MLIRNYFCIYYTSKTRSVSRLSSSQLLVKEQPYCSVGVSQVLWIAGSAHTQVMTQEARCSSSTRCVGRFHPLKISSHLKTLNFQMPPRNKGFVFMIFKTRLTHVVALLQSNHRITAK